MSDTTDDPTLTTPTVPEQRYAPPPPAPAPDEVVDGDDDGLKPYDEVVPELVNAITAVEWLQIRRRFEMATQELATDMTGQMLVACWKKNRSLTGKSEWDQFQAMNHEQMLTFLEVRQDVGEDDSKS